MKKIYAFIVSIIMMVNMIVCGNVTAKAEDYIPRVMTNDIAEVVDAAKEVRDNPSISCMGYIEIYNTGYRYFVTKDGIRIVKINASTDAEKIGELYAALYELLG